MSAVLFGTNAGSVAPRAKGNIYDVSITFGGGVYSNGTSVVKAIGYFNSSTKLLYTAALNSGRTNGFIFVGSKRLRKMNFVECDYGIRQKLL